MSFALLELSLVNVSVYVSQPSFAMEQPILGLALVESAIGKSQSAKAFPDWLVFVFGPLTLPKFIRSNLNKEIIPYKSLTTSFPI